MQPLPLALPIASYKLPNPSASCSRLLNCYIEQAAPDSNKGPSILRRAPGISTVLDLEDVDGDTGRGLYNFNDELYALVGATLSKVSAGHAVTTVGTVPGSERVTLADNGEDFVIWRPFNDTIYSSDGATVAQLTDPMLDDGAASPCFVDGYLVFRRPNTPDFFNTGLNALTFNGLDIASAEGAPGNIVGLIVDNREVIPLKERTTELWYNAGNSPGSPFSRSPSGFLQLGTAAGQSPGSIDNSPFWLANDLTVRRLAGSTPTRVSQHGIEAILQRTSVSDAYGLTYTQEGHLFYCVVLPFAARTIVYDCTTQQWHERDSLGYGAWRPSHIVSCYGRQYVLDRVSGKLGILDPDTHEEFGEPQRVAWTYQPVYAQGNRVSHRRLELGLGAGKGTAIGQGQHPLATLKVSDDGGETFDTLPTVSLGAMGQYDTTVDWWNLGESPNRVYQIEVTDPVQLFITNTVLHADGARL